MIVETLNWVFWSIGVCAVIVAAFLGVAWVVYWVADTVTESRRQKTFIADRAGEAYRWLSGFRDLDIIWDYVFGTDNRSIDEVRKQYAAARGTDVYGKPLQ